MKEAPKPLYWDTCNFIRHVAGPSSEKCYDSICQYVEEAKAARPRWQIYYSPIMIAEFLPQYLEESKYGDIDDFVADLGGAFTPIDPNPNIMSLAGKMRGVIGRDKSEPRKPTGRSLGLGDAIHLATCVFARDVLEIEDIVFQSLDEGKGKSWEGKCYPLIGFEDWFPPGARCPMAELIIGLKRELPIHPEPRFEGFSKGVANANATGSAGNRPA